jgi:arabinofuranosyltransferase
MQTTILPAILLLTTLFLGSSFCNYSDMILHGRQYDDAYITYRYAVNLAEGNGLVFNSYEKVNSASSFLYTLFLTGLYKLGFQNLERVAAIIGLTSGCLLILFTSLLVFRIIGNALLTALLLLPLFISGSITGWAVSGMETIFFSMLIMAFLWAYYSDRSAISLALLAACLLTRLEGITLLVSLLFSEWIDGGFRLRNRRLAVFAFTGAISFGGLVAFYLCYYGTAVPHPVLLKKYALYYSHPFFTSLEETLTFLIKYFGLYTIPGIGGAVFLLWSKWSEVRTNRAKARIPRSSLSPTLGELGDHIQTRDVLVAVYILLSVLSYIVGPASDQNRYMIPLVPVLAVATALVCRYWVKSCVTPRRALLIFGVILLTLATYQATRNQMRVAQFFNKTAEHQMAREAMGQWIKANVPPDEIILSSDIGAIAYFAKSHDFIDVYGLTSKAPVMALGRNNWLLFINELKEKKPLWVADTGFPNGKISAIEKITRPSEYYHGLSSQGEPYLNLYNDSNKTVLSIPVRESYTFRIVQIDPRVYEDNRISHNKKPPM